MSLQASFNNRKRVGHGQSKGNSEIYDLKRITEVPGNSFMQSLDDIDNFSEHAFFD